MEINYPHISPGRTIGYVSADNEFMREAAKTRNECSTDLRHPTGAVVVFKDEIIGKGANQSVLRSKILLDWHGRGWCVRKLLKIPSGKKYWLCPGCSPARYHAEARAVKDALAHRSSLLGANLYLYGHWWCCKPCWDAMIKAGIKDVYLVEGAKELFGR